MEQQGAVPEIEFKELTKAACRGRFNCGAAEVNSYLRRDAWKLHNQLTHRVTYSHYPTVSEPNGFVALAAVTEEIRKLPGTFYHRFGGAERFPCLQLVWLGVGTRHQGNKIGKRLVAKAIDTFADVGQKIGLPHLILVPISNDVKPFYRNLGFEEYDNGARMYLPLQTAILASAL